jgi:hypothetical protein
MDEMEVDVEQGRLFALLADEVALPDAVKECLRYARKLSHAPPDERASAGAPMP